MLLLKKLYPVNKWFTIITILLCFTFWGGIIALPILGLAQIIMSIIMFVKFNKLSHFNKTLLIVYIFTTLIIFYLLKLLIDDEILFMLIWGISSIFIATFHLYITYVVGNLKGKELNK
jgi:hypothetical protein